MKLSSGKSSGSAHAVMSVGLILVGMSASVFAVDLPAYFNYRNQLQTITDAAALAGGAHMYESQTAAKSAAYTVASQNPFAGKKIASSNLSYSFGTGTMTVTASAQAPTIMSQFMCGMVQKLNPGTPGAIDIGNCGTTTVVAGSKISTSARDTILVIDTSSSMTANSSTPFNNVKTAAQNFVTTMQNIASPGIDQIGLVSFDQAAVTQQALTAPSGGIYPNLTSKIKALKTFSGSGFNTNYTVALKAALDELNLHGRPNSIKNIIFLTDGHPNLPGKTGNSDINTCMTYYQQNKRSQSISCTQAYITYMTSQIEPQVTRAQQMNVRIDTIQIGDIDDADDVAIFRSMMYNNSFLPKMSNGQIPLEYIATKSHDIYNVPGAEYYSASSDESTMQAIYNSIAQKVHLKLANN